MSGVARKESVVTAWAFINKMLGRPTHMPLYLNTLLFFVWSRSVGKICVYHLLFCFYLPVPGLAPFTVIRKRGYSAQGKWYSSPLNEISNLGVLLTLYTKCGPIGFSM